MKLRRNAGRRVIGRNLRIAKPLMRLPRCVGEEPKFRNPSATKSQGATSREARKRSWPRAAGRSTVRASRTSSVKRAAYVELAIVRARNSLHFPPEDDLRRTPSCDYATFFDLKTSRAAKHAAITWSTAALRASSMSFF
jgi:hypothetical protein